MIDKLSALPLAAVLAATLTGGGATAGPITTVPTDDLAWETTQEGVGFAALIGDRFTEEYMAMVRLPAGLVSPTHVKTANMFGVVVAGTISHVAADADPANAVLLPEGSFYMVPAGLAHLSKCVSDFDCVTFLVQDGAFDFLPVAQ